MIKQFSDIEKYIGKMLEKQSTLSKDRIKNGLSIRGIDMIKFLTSKVGTSYELTDSIIIFESSIDDDDLDFTESLHNNTIRETVKASVYITIYGNSSNNLAKILKARFESEKVKTDLLEEGIYLSSISSGISVNEFINNTLWHRTDMTITILFELIHNEVDTALQIDDINEIIYY